MNRQTRRFGTSWALVFGLWMGVFSISLFWGGASSIDLFIIRELRFPRVFLASILGMGLAVTGATLQSLFSNPLCEPYTLGISSGAALGAVLGMSSGLLGLHGGVAGAAFLGAMVFAGILDFLARRPGSSNTMLLLAGVMLGFLGNSVLSLWMVLSDSNGLQSVMAWLFGDLSRARLQGVFFTALGILLAVFLIWVQWRSLDALLLGEEGAASLGLDVRTVRRRMIFLSSIVVGLCVSAGGMIGFVGLVVPHFVRRKVGSLHFKLIPFCALWGSIVLTMADWISRILVPPYELPVGIVTALIGAPLFLWAMLQRQVSS